MERSEEDKVLQAPVTVTLGGERHQIRPLVIAESREWRRKVAKTIARIPQYTNVTTDTPDQFGDAIEAMLVAMPDEVVDLFFAYARDLPRERIEQTATDAELAAAFDKVMEVAFPLAQSLARGMTRMSQ